MGTRSRNGVENEDGTVTSIYCHRDGYPSGVAATLLEAYNAPERVRALIDLGDLSCLYGELEPPAGVVHTFDAPVKGVTIAYKRDRGERNVDPVTHIAQAWPDYGQEYLYLFRRSGEWAMVQGDQPTLGWAPLA